MHHLGCIYLAFNTPFFLGGGGGGVGIPQAGGLVRTLVLVLLYVVIEVVGFGQKQWDEGGVMISLY